MPLKDQSRTRPLLHEDLERSQKILDSIFNGCKPDCSLQQHWHSVYENASHARAFLHAAPIVVKAIILQASKSSTMFPVEALLTRRSAPTKRSCRNQCPSHTLRWDHSASSARTYDQPNLGSCTLLSDLCGELLPEASVTIAIHLQDGISSPACLVSRVWSTNQEVVGRCPASSWLQYRPSFSRRRVKAPAIALRSSIAVALAEEPKLVTTSHPE